MQRTSDTPNGSITHSKIVQVGKGASSIFIISGGANFLWTNWGPDANKRFQCKFVYTILGDGGIDKRIFRARFSEHFKDGFVDEYHGNIDKVHIARFDELLKANGFDLEPKVLEVLAAEQAQAEEQPPSELAPLKPEQRPLALPSTVPL